MGLVFSRYFYHLPFNRFVHSLRLPHLFVFVLPCLFLPLLLFVLSIFPIFFDNYWKNGFGIFCELLWMIFTFFILQHTVCILPILCFPHPLPSTNFLFKCLPYLTKLVSFLGPTKSSSFAGWMQLPQRCCVFFVLSGNAWFGKPLPRDYAGHHSISVCPTLLWLCTGVLKVF